MEIKYLHQIFQQDSLMQGNTFIKPKVEYIPPIIIVELSFEKWNISFRRSKKVSAGSQDGTGNAGYNNKGEDASGDRIGIEAGWGDVCFA